MSEDEGSELESELVPPSVAEPIAVTDAELDELIDWLVREAKP